MEFYQINLRDFAQINGAGHDFHTEMTEYLIKVSHNIRQYERMFDASCAKRYRKRAFKEILRQFNICKTHWCSHMVRHAKHPSVKAAYNEMFDSLFSVLAYMLSHENQLCYIEKKFLHSVVYTGFLYREIGYLHNSDDNNYTLKLEYDNSYCSWNANDNVDKIHHMRDGARYNIRIVSKATDEDFGFSITRFNLFYNRFMRAKLYNSPTEDEVVYKLKRESIISTKKIPLLRKIGVDD